MSPNSITVPVQCSAEKWLPSRFSSCVFHHICLYIFAKKHRNTETLTNKYNTKWWKSLSVEWGSQLMVAILWHHSSTCAPVAHQDSQTWGGYQKVEPDKLRLRSTCKSIQPISLNCTDSSHEALCWRHMAAIGFYDHHHLMAIINFGHWLSDAHQCLMETERCTHLTEKSN